MNPSELPQSVIDMMSQADRESRGLKTTQEQKAEMLSAAGKTIERAERQTQDTVEAWLRQNGYWPRTPYFLNSGSPPESGWYIHLHETRRNPYLLDLLILRNDGRWVEIELKTSTGRIRTEQADIIRLTGAPVFRSAQDAIDWLADQGWGAR